MKKHHPPRNAGPVELRHRGGLPGLIYKTKTGVLYSNQSGGHACKHPEAVGCLVPLDDREYPENAGIVLDQFFTGEKWGGWCRDGIDEETADFLDDLFGPTITVDRTLLGESMEAWIHCVVNYPESEEKAEDSKPFVDLDQLSEIFGVELAVMESDRLPEGKAILVWFNSD